MKLTKYIVGIIFGLSVLSCSEKWDNHYNTQPETVNQNLWDAMQSDAEISLFVKYLKDNRYDTLFATNNTYTIFAPVNAALTQFIATEQVTKGVLDYLIATHFVQAVNVQGKQKLQTLSEKFALFENIGTHATFDGLDLPFESPLYLNGKYFRMNQMASPRPNLYEFIAQDNPILKRFIDAQDSIILDKEKSRPIGFDENGNTVYDSVSIKVNRFEMKYFPISEEFRNITATIAFPRWDKYEDALDVMAGKLGGIFKTAADIPYEWQKEILIPHLLDHGVFLNMIEVNEFLPKHAKDTAKLQNILGDSVIINYLPSNRVICSNGYAYDYAQFTIPDSLYSGKSRLEGEHLVREAGINKFVWRDSVKVNASSSFEPVREFILGASKDSILKVNFPKGYSGTFNVQFNSMRLFPRKYLMVVRTHMDIGGKYNIYINNTLVKTFEYYDYVRGRGIITGVNGTRYTPEGRFNRFDCWVNNITEYGTAKIRFEYVGPNNTPSNGFVVDYIEFVPF